MIDEEQIGGKQELVSKEEISRAAQGVEEFKTVFNKSSVRQRKFLRYNDDGEKVQAMFLGIRPVGQMETGSVDVLSSIDLPERFGTIGRFLYDKTLVDNTITNYPQIFDDFINGEDSADTYMRKLLDRRPETSNDPEDIRRIGVLLGFPEDAVDEFAINYPLKKQMMYFFTDQARYSSGQDSGFTKSEKEILKFLASIGPRSLRKYNNFLDNRGDEVRAYLESIKLFGRSSLPTEYIDFTVNNRIVSVHGFDFGTGSPTNKTLEFPDKVNTLFELSGMNRFLRSSSFLFKR